VFFAGAGKTDRVLDRAYRCSHVNIPLAVVRIAPSGLGQVAHRMEMEGTMPVLPFVYPDELQTWSHVGVACGIVLLLEILALIGAFFILRQRSALRYQWIWGLAPLMAAVASFAFASYAHYQYWYYSTQRDAVVGQHGGVGANDAWSTLIQRAINQIRPYGIATVTVTVLMFLLGVILIARWAFRRRGPAASANAAAPAPQPA